MWLKEGFMSKLSPTDSPFITEGLKQEAREEDLILMIYILFKSFHLSHHEPKTVLLFGTSI